MFLKWRGSSGEVGKGQGWEGGAEGKGGGGVFGNFICKNVTNNVKIFRGLEKCQTAPARGVFRLV